MRILKFLFSSAVMVAVVALVLFFSSREVLLFLAGQRIENDLSEFGVISKNYNAVNQKCKLKGAVGQVNLVEELRLRFTDEHAYVTEAICEQFPNDPVVLQKHVLPPFVGKLPGYSGVIWGTQASGIVLELWGRQKRVGVVEGVIQSSASFAPGQLQPATSCRGFSQFCCQSETQVGEGELNRNVTDCSQSCYSVCQSRPVVLSFVTDPFFDQTTRVLQLDQETPVIFPFVVQSPSSTEEKKPQVTIDFGDGETEQVTEFTGEFTHTYACATQCSFVATLTIEDHLGRTSAVTPVSKITVTVN